MTSKSQVTLTFIDKGVDNLVSAMGRVGTATKGMADDVDKSAKSFKTAGDRMDSLGDKAGSLDTRAMGFRDAITGAQDLSLAIKGVDEQGNAMSAPERLFTLGAGVGDLASSVENLAVPMAKAAQQWVTTHARMVASSIASATRIAVTWAVNAAKAAASVVASVATQIAQWTLLGMKSLLAAGKVALAWMISMGPIILVGLAVAALVFLIIKYWDEIKAAIMAAYEYIKAITVAAWGMIKETIVTVVGWIVAYYKFMFNLIWTTITTVWEWIQTGTQEAWDLISSVISTVLDTIHTTVMNALDLVSGVITGAWEFVSGETSRVWNSIKDFIGDIITSAADMVSTEIDRVVGFFTDLPGRITGALGTLASAITSPFTTGISGIKSAWNRLVGGKGFSVPSWVPGVGGKEFRIPKLHSGGIFRAPPGKTEGLALLRDGEKVSTTKGYGGSGMGTITIESGGSAMDDLLVQILRRAITVKGGNVQEVLGVRGA